MTRKLVVFALIVAFCGLAFGKEKSLEELKARVAEAKLSEQPKLYTEIAQREMDSVDQLYRAGDIEKAQASVTELATDCDKAVKTSVDARKHMKDTEIALRKIADRLKDISRQVEFENRPAFKSAIDRIERGRTTLLNAMFTK